MTDRTPTSIWKNDDFLSLTAGAQRLYVFLFSQARSTHGAILPLTPRRWALKAADLTVEDILRDLSSLDGAGYIAVDEEIEEVFVSGVFAADEIGSQPRRARGAYAQILAIDSPRLRAIASAELASGVAKSADKIPTGLRAQVLARDGYECLRCGWSPERQVITDPDELAYVRGLEVDHIQPRSRGGSNDLGNLQTLCTDCNSAKGASV